MQSTIQTKPVAQQSDNLQRLQFDPHSDIYIIGELKSVSIIAGSRKDSFHFHLLVTNATNVRDTGNRD